MNDADLRELLKEKYNTPINGEDCITFHHMQLVINEVRREFESNTKTPSSRWRENEESDPHGHYYDCERSKLCKGVLTDDELANEVYLKPNIGNLTAAKERIRWLSRKLEKAL